MRLFLSSYRLGNRPDALLRLLRGRTRTALILNAADYKTPEERNASLERDTEEMLALGLAPQEVDLRWYFGRPEDTRRVLATFDLLYLRGGSVFLLRRALRQSGADDAIRDLLADDALVFAGYSAGPCMLGPTLRGIHGYEDDPRVAPPPYEPEPVWDGLGVLPYAIEPHFQPEGPRQGAVPYYEEHGIPYVTLRDGEALVVDGDHEEVVG